MFEKNPYAFKTVGFVLDDLSSSQTAYCLIKNINKRVEEKIDPSVVLFTIDNAIPCIQPNVPIFNIRDTFGFNGFLIATSPRTIKQLDNCTRSKIYYYIQDLKQLSESSIEDVLRNKSIQKIYRSHDYEYAPYGLVVEDYDIDKIIEILGVNNESNVG